jgi:starvation-inducible DNA-binding protein
MTMPRKIFGLSETSRSRVTAGLNEVLARALALRDLYKKAHWQVTGLQVAALHSRFEGHHVQRSELIDELGERVQTLDGVAIVLARDVAAVVDRRGAGRARDARA